ncbi:MAG: GIY-YIG nuclease family protein [Balneolaceae bacterium]|nr:GIY-YIG nuclease family protein [Balneolaceae bacterium]
MYYVYILKSTVEDWYYVGHSSDLRERLKDHNAGKVIATKSRRPYMVDSYIAVQEEETAIALEKYFKTGSAIAWMNKRLLSEK